MFISIDAVLIVKLDSWISGMDIPVMEFFLIHAWL